MTTSKQNTVTAKSERPGSLTADGGQAALENGLTHGLSRLEGLVGRGDLVAAWELAKKLQQQWPDDEDVRRFARVLVPPTVAVRHGSSARPRRREYQWLREHSHEHPGCWLAVLDERLIAVSPDVKVVVDAIRGDPTAKDALLHFEPEVPAWR